MENLNKFFFSLRKFRKNLKNSKKWKNLKKSRNLKKVLKNVETVSEIPL